MATPSPSGKKRRGGLQLAVLFGGLAVISAGTLFLIWPSEAVLEITLSTEPASGQFTIDEETRLRVWADLDADLPGIGIHGDSSTLPYPHVIDFDIVIRQGETTIAERRCDPFYFSSAHGISKHSNRRMLEAPLDDCSFQLPAGTYQVEAKVVEGPQKYEGFNLREGILLLRPD